jgi:2-methylcitrate dehydratase PrpD
MDTTETLATFITSFDGAKIPEPVRAIAVRSLVNWAGCALGGARHPALLNAMTAMRPFIGAPQASVIGRNDRVDALNAALFNGIGSHVLDFDDTHMATLVHPSGPVLSALLALAEYHPIDGNTFVEAIVFGIEVECRIALGVCPAHYDIGWHVTGTVGGFGAAAAVGRALKLDAKQMAWALGIAATQAAGLREVFGTMCKSLHPGRAAQSGLSAALMAQAGFTSSLRAIEAPRGFAHVLSTEQHFEKMTKGLGTVWHTLENSFKPYACGLVIHPIIDGCLTLRQQHQFSSDDVKQIDLKVHPLVLELTGKSAPTTGLEGKFSVQHSAAIVTHEGKSQARQYSDAAVQDPAVTKLRSKVQVAIEPGLRVDEAKVTVVLNDGRVLHHHVVHALGSIERPMNDAQVDAKFMDLASTIMTPEQATQALAACRAVGQAKDAGAVGRALSTPK